MFLSFVPIVLGFRNYISDSNEAGITCTYLASAHITSCDWLSTAAACLVHRAEQSAGCVTGCQEDKLLPAAMLTYFCTDLLFSFSRLTLTQLPDFHQLHPAIDTFTYLSIYLPLFTQSVTLLTLPTHVPQLR